MTEPGYHRQPHTQDPLQKPPEEDAPLAQGHLDDDGETADQVREAIEQHKETVEDEKGTPEVTARAPGDHAGSGDDSGSDDDQNGEPPTGTVEEVKTWVGDDPDRARQALDAENAGSAPRATLVSHLEGVANR